MKNRGVKVFSIVEIQDRSGRFRQLFSTDARAWREDSESTRSVAHFDEKQPCDALRNAKMPGQVRVENCASV